MSGVIFGVEEKAHYIELAAFPAIFKLYDFRMGVGL